MTAPPDYAASLRDLMREHWYAAGRPSYRALARAAGTSHTTVGQFLTGVRGAPAWPATRAIAVALGVKGEEDLAAIFGLHRQAAEQNEQARTPPAAGRATTERLACPACGVGLVVKVREQKQ